MKDIQKLLLQDKPVGILLAIKRLEKPYAAVIMREVDTTHAHTANVISQMEKFGLIESKKEGRIKYVQLTSYGRYITDALERLIKSIGNSGETDKHEEIDENVLNEKLKIIRKKIETIFKEEVENQRNLDKYDATRISRRLGPYRREILKAKDHIKKGSTIKNTINDLDTRIDEILQQVKEISE